MSDFREVFRNTMAIRWGDMDAFGHVNNTMYFRYMEQLRIEWLESIGMPPPLGQGPVIVNANMNFRKQLRYPARIVCTMSARPPGNSSVDTRFELRREDEPDTIYADGGALIVWVHYAEARSMRLPDEIRALLPAPPDVA